jgi:hypothetical protein
MEPTTDVAEPTSAPLMLPEGYGTATQPLAWSAVRARLETALHYWMATTRPDGRPHVVPRWGVWLDESWFYDGSPATRHARNLATNPAAVLHLEDGKQAVVLEGESHQLTPHGELRHRLAAAFAKYHAHGYRPTAESWDAGGMWRFSPRRGFAWTQYPIDATRFEFTT